MQMSEYRCMGNTGGQVQVHGGKNRTIWRIARREAGAVWGAGSVLSRFTY